MPEIKSYVTTFIGDLRGAFLDLAIIVGVVAFFQFFILRSVPPEWPSMLIGLLVVMVGLALFMRGLQVGIFPLGESLAGHLSSSSSRVWLIIFAFVIGFATTIAEPALTAIATKAASISSGYIDALSLRLVVALSVGAAIVLGVFRLLWNHPIHYYIIGGYTLAIILAFFVPPEIVALAFDSGGITTSTVTVPLIAALGIGLASSLKNRNPLIDGFGLIAFASVLPMLFVQVYGIFAYSSAPSAASEIGSMVHPIVDGLSALLASSGVLNIGVAARGFLGTLGSVMPIASVIVFFYWVVIRKPIERFSRRAFGFGMVVVGLYAFVYGLEAGLFPIGESLARALAEQGNVWFVYLFSFTIGFATTMAEPALTMIARKAEEVSGGSINQFLLRVFVASGAGFGIFLGAYRIIHGDPVIWYLAIGYAAVVVLTLFAPRTIIPIAYDSGGVTTSTITVPIVAALGIGLASVIPGRDPLLDGFGMIALTVLFPILSVLAYGIFENENIRRHERRIARLESDTITRVRGHFSGGNGAVHEEGRTQRLKKEIITVTGFSGSGVTSTVAMVAERLRFRHFSSGGLFRKIALEHGVSVEELNQIAEKHGGIDHEVDGLVQELGETGSKLIIDSRLGYYWIHGSYKVYLTVDPRAAAERVLATSKKHARSGEEVASIEEAMRSIEHRFQSQKKRYHELYGIDITNTKPFNAVIDTTSKSQDEVVNEIVKGYREWFGQKS